MSGARVPTPVTITDGWLAGHVIRRARKMKRCQYNHGTNNGGKCNNIIGVDELYAEMDYDYDAPHPRARAVCCLKCAGEEARRAVALHRIKIDADQLKAEITIAVDNGQGPVIRTIVKTSVEKARSIEALLYGGVLAGDVVPIWGEPKANDGRDDG